MKMIESLYSNFIPFIQFIHPRTMLEMLVHRLNQFEWKIESLGVPFKHSVPLFCLSNSIIQIFLYSIYVKL